MFLIPKEFKIGAVGVNFTTAGDQLNLAKEGMLLKIEDTELEVIGSESESPIKRVVLGKKFEAKAVIINGGSVLDVYTGAFTPSVE